MLPGNTYVNAEAVEARHKAPIAAQENFMSAMKEKNTEFWDKQTATSFLS